MKEYNLYSIDGVEIPFSPNWNDIAISLSGGADSALLAYLLCELVEQYNKEINIHLISHIRMWKTRPWQQYDANRIYQYLTQLFPNLKFIRYTNFIAPDLEYGFIGHSINDEYGKQVSGDNIQIRAYSEYVCYHNKVNAYYNAVTRNPKNVDFSLDGMDRRDIEPTDDNTHLQLMVHMNVLVSHPFRFTEKSWVIKQYKSKNLMDLFNLTRSCEGDFKNLDYVTYIPYQDVPVCNNCFWCKERNWAIEQNK